jgi:hypothetical protein
MQNNLKLFITTILFVFSSSIFAQTPPVYIDFVRNEDNSVSFNYKKNKFGTYKISVKFQNLDNTYSSDYEGFVSGISGFLFKLNSINPQRGISFNMKYDMILGKPNPKIDTSFAYVLPFGKGSKINMNELTHFGEYYFANVRPKNWKAFHFTTDTSMAVLAVRKGQVVEITDKFDLIATPDQQYNSAANSILIEHEDGTLAYYNGIQKGSFKVKEGEQVYPHTPLGQLEHNNGHKNYALNFTLFFLNDEDYRKLKDKSQTLFTHKSFYEYMNPYFITSDGKQKLEGNKQYVSEINNEIITKELTKRELKKYKK